MLECCAEIILILSTKSAFIMFMNNLLYFYCRFAIFFPSLCKVVHFFILLPLLIVTYTLENEFFGLISWIRYPKHVWFLSRSSLDIMSYTWRIYAFLKGFWPHKSLMTLGMWSHSFCMHSGIILKFCQVIISLCSAAEAVDQLRAAAQRAYKIESCRCRIQKTDRKAFHWRGRKDVSTIDCFVCLHWKWKWSSQ